MGHYDNCRDGYCPVCGAAPGNMRNGVCTLCPPTVREREELVVRRMQPAKAPSVRLGSGDYRHDPTPPVIPTDDEIAAWADGFIQAKAFNRPIAIQIAVEAAKWVRAKMQQPR